MSVIKHGGKRTVKPTGPSIVGRPIRLSLFSLLLLAFSLMLTACGDAPTSNPSPVSATAVPTVGESQPATSVPVDAATAEVAPTSEPTSEDTSGGGGPCDKLNAAQYTISGYLQRIRAVKGDDDYQAAKAGTFRFKLDPSELQGAVDTLAGMPEFVGEKVSAQVPKFQQMADLLESNLQSGKPFTDGSGNGQKLADLVDKEFVDSLSALDDAIVKNKCRDY